MLNTGSDTYPSFNYSLLQLQWMEAEIVHRYMKNRITKEQRTKLRKHKKLERANRRLGR